jgi:hypothetical protein
LRSCLDSRVSRVPTVKTSVVLGAARTTACANRSSASAYGVIEPEMSSSSTTRRGLRVRSR